MSIQVKELAFVFHPVSDVARARSFYEGFLSLKVGKQVELAAGQWWIEYDIAGQALAISNAVPGKSADSLNLEVTNLDDAVNQVRAGGIPVAYELMDFPHCRIFGIKDPDGNQIGLHQLKAKA